MTAKPLMAMHHCLLIAPRLDKKERGDCLYTMLSSLMVITVKREIENLYTIKRESVGIRLLYAAYVLFFCHCLSSLVVRTSD